ncbi:MAG TPA: hypothetical protein VFQ88_04860 [Nevskiaceae bacterium]|nr:hypothetical protein [Nevskiaceae bacterium]
MTTPILLSWSGGKDCLMALLALRADPTWDVVGLLTTITARYDRISIHGVRCAVLQAQASALGLPLIEARLDEPADNATYERAHAAALQAAQARWPGLRHCAFGDLFLADVRSYREQQLARAGWQAVFPLWGLPTGAMAHRFIGSGHRAMVVCVDTTQLAAFYCGHEFDASFLTQLPAGVDPCGERGEFHTLSFSGPAFRAPVRLRSGTSVLRDGRFQYTDFELDDTPAVP